MSLKILLVLLALSGLIGVGFGYFLRWIISLGKIGSMELDIKQKMLEAQEEAKKLITEAERKAEIKVAEITKDLKEKEKESKKTANRLIKKEELLDKRQSDMDKEHDVLKSKVEDVAKLRSKIDEMIETEQKKLEQIAEMSSEDAKRQLIKKIEEQAEEDLSVRLQKLEVSAKEKIEKQAQDILITSIHRLGNAMGSDVLSTTVALPSDEIKGKIIGKEGRNIRAFEHATGVDVIVDDTPGTITISSYDPVRRQIARIALENLILDGRIQPAKIEESVKKAEEEINQIIKKKGEVAAYDAKVTNLDPKLLMILGRLYFRSSYGQNVLDHSVEMSHLAGMIAAEVGADVAVARAGALVHDIGKAVDHEVPGTHVEIGRRILQKFKVDEAIIRAMEAHHEEYPYATPESYIVQVADAISGGRPGARRDSVENYIKRLEDLEAIANNKPGVLKTYAIAAGREVRVFVKPEEISDYEAQKLARDIAKDIEKEMQYPGEIKVHVIRESRSIEYAR